MTSFGEEQLKQLAGMSNLPVSGRQEYSIPIQTKCTQEINTQILHLSTFCNTLQVDLISEIHSY